MTHRNDTIEAAILASIRAGHRTCAAILKHAPGCLAEERIPYAIGMRDVDKGLQRLKRSGNAEFHRPTRQWFAHDEALPGATTPEPQA